MVPSLKAFAARFAAWDLGVRVLFLLWCGLALLYAAEVGYTIAWAVQHGGLGPFGLIPIAGWWCALTAVLSLLMLIDARERDRRMARNALMLASDMAADLNRYRTGTLS